MKSNDDEYLPLQHEDEKHGNTRWISTSRVRCSQYSEETQYRLTDGDRHMLKILPWILHLLLFVGSICAGLIASKMSAPNDCFREKTDILVGKRQKPVTVRFDGSLNRNSSPFKGPPSADVDRAWDKILPLHLITIPEPVFQTLNASKYSAKFPENVATGRLGMFDTLHLLHCVRSLWTLAYPEYYLRNGTGSWTQEQKDDWFSHIDHCADMLRQKLMCDASSALVTYSWLENHYHPHPNFNVEHKCRNFDELLDATERLQVPPTRVPKEGFFRPSDAPVVEFVDPPFDPKADGKLTDPRGMAGED